MKNGKQSTNIHKGDNPNPLLKHGCVDVSLDHYIYIYILPKSQTQERGINKRHKPIKH